MRKAWILGALLLCSAPAARADWPAWKAPTPVEWAVLGAGVGLIWWDVGITRRALTLDGYSENNPILGRNPSQGKVFWIGGVLPTLVLTGVFVALPPKVRLIPAGIVIIAEAGNLTAMKLAGVGWQVKF